jgi:hypothetical protein
MINVLSKVALKIKTKENYIFQYSYTRSAVHEVSSTYIEILKIWDKGAITSFSNAVLQQN